MSDIRDFWNENFGNPLIDFGRNVGIVDFLNASLKSYSSLMTGLARIPEALTNPSTIMLLLVGVVGIAVVGGGIYYMTKK